jgi:site-specific recombinase XerD
VYEDCPNLLKDFLFYMETIKGRSHNTVYAYYKDLRLFFRFLKIHRKLTEQTDLQMIPIDDITLDLIQTVTLSDVYEFLHYLSQTSQSNTRARKVSCLRGFFKYLYNNGKIKENPIESLELPSPKKSLPKYLNLEECLELLTHIDGPFRERDYCMITLFLNCGMRLSELVGINFSDIKLSEDQESRILLRGKGNKERIVYLNDACITALQDYIRFRNTHFQNAVKLDKDALFLSRTGRRIGARQVERIIENALKSSGLSGMGYSTHKLRHTAATMMYQHGNVDIRVLQEILGHTNLGTTQIYTHVSSEQMKQAVTTTPLSKMKPQKDKGSISGHTGMEHTAHGKNKDK